MPVDMSRYPKEWFEISRYVRFERAAGRCECVGECGRGHIGRCTARHRCSHPETGSIVILTTMHLGVPHSNGSPGDKHDKGDCRLINLKAACQACHLAYDADEHLQNRRETARKVLIAAGQMSLFDIYIK